MASFNIPQKTGGFSSNLRDAFPEMSKDIIPNCSEIGTLNTIVGIIGLLQANEVLKLICDIGKPLIDILLIYNSLENTQYKMKLKNTDSCHSERMRRILQIFKQESYFDANCEIQDNSLLITGDELKNELYQKSQKQIQLISVIEDISTSLPFQVDAKIPLSKFDTTLLELDKNTKHIIVCQKGISSYTATQKIKDKYPEMEVFSLKGGINNY